MILVLQCNNKDTMGNKESESPSGFYVRAFVGCPGLLGGSWGSCKAEASKQGICGYWPFLGDF